MFSSIKIYLFIGIAITIAGLVWGLKTSIENNAVKDIIIQNLKQDKIELDKQRKKEIEIAIFNTKAEIKKQELEKSMKRNRNANQNLIDDDNVYFSL